MSKEVIFQLAEQATGRAILSAGKYVVVAAGTVIGCQLYDLLDVAASQPRAVSAGKVSFRVSESINAVDIYGYLDNGYTFNVKNLKPGDISTFYIDTSNVFQTLFYPFNVGGSGEARTISASAENKTGWFIPNGVLVNAQGSGIACTLNESGKGIDVGTDGVNSGTDDPDGFIDGASLAATGFKPATIGYTDGTNSIWIDLTGGTAEWTSGALFHPGTSKSAKAEGTDSTTTKNGIYIYTPYTAINSGTNTTELSYTFTGTPTAVQGLIVLQWQIPQVPAI